ncbi:MAG TPA: 3-dehydroquinate synthase [Caulobacteraceae bacterium]|nr:3-dehydroquinate synthase [Caulobacteraceae bacterium]
MTCQVGVALGDRAYEVVIGPGLIAGAGARIGRLLARPRVVVVTDETVRGRHGQALADALGAAGIQTNWIVLAPGEGTKTFAGLEALCDRLLALELDRKDVLLAFGGGVVGDLAGFAAAIFKRGIDFVQLPTTLLAQVDASVGGKTAIDTARGKNLIGAFHQPRLVLADLDLLSSLPRREVACGYAEILKCALLGDADFFARLEQRGDEVLSLVPTPLEDAVVRAVAMKAAIVAEDEKEGGRRALLNLGHTFGHALEAETGFSATLQHGEAVALGCALAFRFSAELGLCPAADAERAEAAIRAAGLPAFLGETPGAPFSAQRLLAHMAQDKKALGGAISLVLVRGIGEAFVAGDIDRDRLGSFLVGAGARP